MTKIGKVLGFEFVDVFKKKCLDRYFFEKEKKTRKK